MSTHRKWLAWMLAVAFAAAVGCGDRDTPAEEAGESMEEAGDEIEDAVDD